MTINTTLRWTGLVVALAALTACAGDQNQRDEPGKPTPQKAKKQADKPEKQAATKKEAAKETADKPTKSKLPRGWLRWRGPGQDGVSEETDLVNSWEPGGKNQLWSKDLKGRGTVVVNRDRAYAWGYRGEGRNLVEVLACLDADTGETLWEKEFPDFLSDIIYNRYSIGAPTVDRETGNVYLMTTPGLLMGFTPEGEQLWSHSMMERFGRMDFPNGRTGVPAIDGELVIVNTISNYWGRYGPTRNRFYAFDKRTGEPVWISTPGVGPPFLKDSSFSTPVFATDQQGRRVFYCGTGDGNIVCVNAKTGEPIWRYQLAIGGVNSSVVLHGEGEDRRLIAIHGKENLDSSSAGRMVALDVGAEPRPPKKSEPGETPILPDKAELWRIDGMKMFTSSPTLVGDRVYQVASSGRLHCINVHSGEVIWSERLGTSQLHASPLHADGKLYVPIHEGTFWILDPQKDGAKVLAEVELEGDLIGSPSVWDGKFYLFTTKKLYCFGEKDNSEHLPEPAEQRDEPKAGKLADLQVVPYDVLLKPGESRGLSVRGLDRRGFFTGNVAGAKWSAGEPKLDASVTKNGAIKATKKAELSAGTFEAKAKDAAGTVRGRVMPDVPFSEDFESYKLNMKTGDGTKFALPPLPWIGARGKWDIRSHGGSRVLAKTLKKVILQRAVTFIGHPDSSGYTLSADVMTGGGRRLAGEVGLINQRYMIVLKGNHDAIEVNSNHDRLKVKEPFEVEPGTWYRLKTRVDHHEDGSATVRGKAWPRGGEEPDEWTITVKHQHGHERGSPGLFGFGPQNRVRVYIDNINVEPNPQKQ